MKTKDEEYHDFSDIIDESKKDFSDYIDKRLALAKLKAYEKIANLSGRIMYGVVILVFVFILSILSVITIGLFLGKLLDNYALGFGSMFLVFILFIALISLNRKRVRRFFVNKTLRTIKRIESDED